MKLKLITIQFFGALFFIKGFDIIEYLIFNKNELEIFRSQSSFSFYTYFDEISYWLYFISATGFVGLIIATIISFFMNKKMGYKRWPLVIAFLLVFLSNKFFIDLTQIIDFRSSFLGAFSVKFLMAAGGVISLAIGFFILVMAKYLKTLNYYFKIHN